MSQQLLQPGLRLELSRPDADRVYYTKIEEVGSQEIVISALFGSRAHQELLHEGETVNCSFIQAENISQGTYSFSARVLRREHSNVQLYVLSRPKDFTRTQMRNFARVQTLIPVEFSLEDSRHWQTGSAIDLSGAGMKLAHKVPMEANAGLTLIFSLRPGQDELALRGRVVRCVRAEGIIAGAYHSGIEFLDISVPVQDKIVGFVFTRMLEIRRLGEG